MKINLINIDDAKNYDKKDWAKGETIIFSDEWNLRKKQCQNFIKAHNKIYDRKVHGRKCTVKEISNVIGKDFLNNNHIQGSNNLAIVFFGLFEKDELIGVMSLGRHSRKISSNTIVLDRFCIADGVHVQGGATKLFYRCIEWSKARNYDQIISFSDNRWTDGHIYEILGFSLEKNHKPDYCYVDTKNPIRRLSKQSQKKSSSKCPKDMTELEWANFRGLKRLWDCGKKRWVYQLNKDTMSWKQNLSNKCAMQHQNGDFKHSHIRGYFKSSKCNTEIYYASSYELRTIYLLENNPKVFSYRRGDVFVDDAGLSRNPDLYVKYINGIEEIIEVKPESMLNRISVKIQICETKKYAEKNGYNFYVWSEKDSELQNEKSIINWAKKFIAETTGNTEWIDKQQKSNRKKAKKFYHEHTAKDKVEIWCDYCKKTHHPLRITYNKNIQRNSEYICERKGGFVSGSKTKKKKDNPYSSEGKKQCNKCKCVKLFKDFGFDKFRSDGYASRCKNCRAISAKEKYKKN